MIVSGNKEKGLAKSLYKLYPDAEFLSKSTGYDLCKKEHQYKFALKCLSHDTIVNCSALWRFEQTTLLDTIYKVCVEHNHCPHIINIGSTTDRVKNGKPWLYNAEKKALRDYSNTLALGGVWDKKPKISYISFGTLSNNQSKHPDRKTIDIDEAALYIKWLIDQPNYVNINEFSIDPMQDTRWYD
jgi:NADP-dependent 3-hydroxy acid dehydrogenase YdfG